MASKTASVTIGPDTQDLLIDEAYVSTITFNRQHPEEGYRVTESFNRYGVYYRRQREEGFKRIYFHETLVLHPGDEIKLTAKGLAMVLPEISPIHSVTGLQFKQLEWLQQKAPSLRPEEKLAYRQAIRSQYPNQSAYSELLLALMGDLKAKESLHKWLCQENRALTFSDCRGFIRVLQVLMTAFPTEALAYEVWLKS